MAADLDLTTAANQPWYLYDVFLPESAPAAPVDDLFGGGAGNLSDGEYKYKVTLVTAEGETDAGTASLGVTVADHTVDGQVALSSIPTGTAGRCTARNLYRTIAGGSSYFFLATIADNSTTTYTDNIADASLGAAAPSVNSTGIFYVALPRNQKVTIAHAGLTTAGADSGAGDYVVVMHGGDTMARNANAGTKCVIWANGDAAVRSVQVHGTTSDGDHVVGLSAVTAGGKVQFIVERIVEI